MSDFKWTMCVKPCRFILCPTNDKIKGQSVNISQQLSFISLSSHNFGSVATYWIILMKCNCTQAGYSWEQWQAHVLCKFNSIGMTPTHTQQKYMPEKNNAKPIYIDNS